MGYAEKTTVPIEKTKAEIERLVRMKGGTNYSTASMDEKNLAAIVFMLRDRYLRFTVHLPPRMRNMSQAQYDQKCRTAWRALLLYMKGKFEALDSGVVTFEEEFLAQIVLPDSSTAAQYLVPQIAEAYKSGVMPKLLPMLGQ